MKHWLKGVLVLSILAAWMGSPAWAQVAAPRLNSVIPEAPEPFNPATLPWSGPSRIGLGVSYESTEETTTNGVTTAGPEGEGKYNVQGRFVGEDFAVSAESLKIEFSYSNLPNDSIEFEASMVNAAVLLGDMFSIGIGQQMNTLTIDDNTGVLLGQGVPATFEQESSLLQVGLTAQIFENIYLGGAFGTETATESGTIPSFGVDVTAELDRSVRRLGVGYFARSSDGGFHLEAYQELKESAESTDFGTLDEEETTGVTLEIVFANILLGVEMITSEESDDTGVLDEEEDLFFSVGWVPESGLSVTATFFQAEVTDPSVPDSVTNEESTFIGVAWLF